MTAPSPPPEYTAPLAAATAKTGPWCAFGSCWAQWQPEYSRRSDDPVKREPSSVAVSAYTGAVNSGTTKARTSWRLLRSHSRTVLSDEPEYSARAVAAIASTGLVCPLRNPSGFVGAASASAAHTETISSEAQKRRSARSDFEARDCRPIAAPAARHATSSLGVTIGATALSFVRSAPSRHRRTSRAAPATWR